MRRMANTRRKALAGCCALAFWAAAGTVRPAEQAEAQAPTSASARKQEAPPVKVKVETGGGLEAVAGAPPPPSSSTERKAMNGSTAGGAALPARKDVAAGGLVAVSFGEDEATLEVGGARQIVRPGSRIGADTVRSVAPGRIVLERPQAPGRKGGPALVIVTFDASGRSRTQVFWTVDPTRPPAPEVKQP
jgi:hypothetical protein